MAVVPGGIGGFLTSDRPPFTINADVSLGLKVGHRDINQTYVLITLVGLAGLTILRACSVKVGTGLTVRTCDKTVI